MEKKKGVGRSLLRFKIHLRSGHPGERPEFPYGPPRFRELLAVTAKACDLLLSMVVHIGS